jgi:hypothetical protein
MYLVIAETRLGASYVSPPLPHAKANELAAALRHHTALRVSLEKVPAIQTGALRPHSNAN